jgi:hypothetical protein
MNCLLEDEFKAMADFRCGVGRMITIGQKLQAPNAAPTQTPDYQIPQLEASIRYCREKLGLGNKK